MDRYGNKPSFGSLIFAQNDGFEKNNKHDPNDLYFDNFIDVLHGNGICVGQPVPDGLKVVWDNQYANESICGVVDCGKTQKKEHPIGH